MTGHRCRRYLADVEMRFFLPPDEGTVLSCSCGARFAFVGISRWQRVFGVGRGNYRCSMFRNRYWHRTELEVSS